jgi:hypothetical protein
MVNNDTTKICVTCKHHLFNSDVLENDPRFHLCKMEHLQNVITGKITYTPCSTMRYEVYSYFSNRCENGKLWEAKE